MKGRWEHRRQPSPEPHADDIAASTAVTHTNRAAPTSTTSALAAAKRAPAATPLSVVDSSSSSDNAGPQPTSSSSSSDQTVVDAVVNIGSDSEMRGIAAAPVDEPLSVCVARDFALYTRARNRLPNVALEDLVAGLSLAPADLGPQVAALAAERRTALQAVISAHGAFSAHLTVLTFLEEGAPDWHDVCAAVGDVDFERVVREFRTDSVNCSIVEHGKKLRVQLRVARFYGDVAFLLTSSVADIVAAAFAQATPARVFDVSPLPNWPLVCLPMAAMWRMLGTIRSKPKLASVHALLTERIADALRSMLTRLSDAAPSGSLKPGTAVVDVDDAGAVSGGAAHDAPLSLAAESVRKQDDSGDLLIEYISREELVVKAFRVVFESSQQHLWSSVAGDGNCFFRAVTRVFLPLLPHATEKRVSLDLRRAIVSHRMSIGGGGVTPLKASRADADDDDVDDGAAVAAAAAGDDDDAGDGDDTGAGAKRSVDAGSVEKRVKRQKSQLDDFTEVGVDDGATMESAGVWASHVQVLQTAAWLGRRLLLLRPDDRHLHVGERREVDDPAAWSMQGAGEPTPRLLPGSSYAIAPGLECAESAGAASEATITLLFSPWPGHYDAGVSAPLASFYDAMLANDRWGSCLLAMAKAAGYESTCAEFRDKALLAKSLPARVAPAPECVKVGETAAVAVAEARGAWPPSAEVVLAIYCALEVHMETLEGEVGALDRRLAVNALPTETQRERLGGLSAYARVLRRRAALLSSLLSSLPDDRRLLPSLGSLPARLAELLCAPLYRHPIVYMADEIDGIVEGSEVVVGSGDDVAPLCSLTVRGLTMVERCAALLARRAPPPPPPVLSPYGSMYGSHYNSNSSSNSSNNSISVSNNYNGINNKNFTAWPNPSYRIAPLNGTVKKLFEAPVQPPARAVDAFGARRLASEDRVGSISAALSTKENVRKRLLGVDPSDLSSVVGDEVSDDDDDDERPIETVRHNRELPPLNKVLTEREWRGYFTRETGSGGATEWQSVLPSKISHTNLVNMLTVLAELPDRGWPVAVFKKQHFTVPLCDVLLDHCLTAKGFWLKDCTFAPGYAELLQEKLMGSANAGGFQIVTSGSAPPPIIKRPL
jgi:hypothetical protein